MTWATRTDGAAPHLLSSDASRCAVLPHCWQYWVHQLSKHLKSSSRHTLQNFPGKTTREQSQHNEGSRAVQHMAFCTWAGRTTCTSFADSSEKAWPQMRWPSSCTGAFPLSHQAITTLPLPVQFQACIVCLLHKQLHFQSYRLHALEPENPAQGEAQEASVTLQGSWGLGFLVDLVGGFVGWFLFGVWGFLKFFYIFCKFFYGVTLQEVWC